MKRTAQECNIALDRFTTCKTGYSLVDNGLEYGSGQVWLCSSLVDEWLYICLSEYTTSCSDRVDGIVILCIVVKT